MRLANLVIDQEGAYLLVEQREGPSESYQGHLLAFIEPLEAADGVGVFFGRRLHIALLQFEYDRFCYFMLIGESLGWRTVHGLQYNEHVEVVQRLLSPVPRIALDE